MIVAALATFVVGINNEDPNSCWIEGCRYFISSASCRRCYVTASKQF